jgi:hypothetical protein
LARGSTQNPAWARGRATKARRLADTAASVGFRVLELDGAEPTVDNQLALRAAIPVLHVLPEAPQ